MNEMRDKTIIIVDLIIHVCEYKVKKVVVNSKTLHDLRKNKEVERLRSQELFKNCKYIH